MKSKHLILLAAALGSALTLAAETLTAGPKGGRLLETVPQKAEFFVNPERKVEVTFYDAALHPVAPGARVVALTAEPKAGKTTVELEKTATGYISKTPLPPGEPYRVVVQIRETADAKPQNFRIDFNPETCAECKHAEYACTCAGH